jgi:hypothetical protein
MNLIKMALKNTGFKQIRIQYNFTNQIDLRVDAACCDKLVLNDRRHIFC